MCGIAGILHTQPNTQAVDENELLAIRDTMQARGPDDAGVWFNADSSLGLAHRRLSIIDLSTAAKQPLKDQKTGNVIVFNGEIYNYQVLQSDLKKRGIHFSTQSDTEVLLKLYALYGERMVDYLRGMYAFAIWDAKQESLFIARDPFGIKPLYYVKQNNEFYFASQVKALLTSERIGKTLSEAGQVGFYLWGHVPEPFTLYENIQAFPAGYSLTISRSGHYRWQQYFNFNDRFMRAYEQGKSSQFEPETVQTSLSQALAGSVKAHLVADVPVGVFLSAGRDSTTLMGLTSEFVSQAQAITLGFSEYENTVKDEVVLAQSVAKRYAASWRSSYLSESDFQASIKDFWQAMDQPTVDGANTFFVSRAAKQMGLKVTLSGVGADELFAGYKDFALSRKLVTRLSWLAQVPALGKGLRRVLQLTLSPKQASLLEFSGDYADCYLLLRSVFLPWELEKILPKAVVARGLESLQTHLKLKQTMAELPNAYAKMHALQMQWYMKNQLLRDTDWAGMAHSLEIRVPFVDIDLFETVAKLSARWQPNKAAMCHSVKKALPDAILNRQKTGFNTPVADWLQKAQGKTNLTKPQSWAQYVLQHYVGETV